MTSLDAPWLLVEPAAGVQLLAEHDGSWLRGPDLAGDHLPHLAGRTPPTRLGRLLPTVIPQLCELGLATMADDGVRMAYADFTTFETHGIDAFADVVPWAPFTLELAAHRWLGAVDFRYNYPSIWVCVLSPSHAVAVSSDKARVCIALMPRPLP